MNNEVISNHVHVSQSVSDLLLDTHAFIWLMNGDATLSSQTQDFIQTVCQNNLLYFSAISIWEIAMLHTKERLSFSQPLTYWIEKATSLPAIKVIPVDAPIALESCQLPGSFHGDPADWLSSLDLTRIILQALRKVYVATRLDCTAVGADISSLVQSLCES